MLNRNKEIKKDCCKPLNYTFRPYTDGTAELLCKKCGHVVKSFDAPQEGK